MAEGVGGGKAPKAGPALTKQQTMDLERAIIQRIHDRGRAHMGSDVGPCAIDLGLQMQVGVKNSGALGHYDL